MREAKKELKHESAFTNHKYPEWQGEFEAALAEGDPQTLRQRVDAAETAIFKRVQALTMTAQKQSGSEARSSDPNRTEVSSNDASDNETNVEQKAISEAIAKLRAIQRSKLGYPEWKHR